MENKPSLFNLLGAILMMLIGILWTYVSYIKTLHFRESGNIIMGYIFPLLGFIFVLMGIFMLNFFIKSYKIYREDKKQGTPDYFEDQVHSYRKDPSNMDRIRRQKLDKNYEDMSKNLPYFKEKFHALMSDVHREDTEDTENGENTETSERSKFFKYCPFCGETLEKNYNYCPQCGEKLQK
ncbi:MAG: zinc-ribbon domain-containing protein [Peptoniphilus sp.]|nr:zinc-ribbon domain-containing protein [Peptoniphilus sp.]